MRRLLWALAFCALASVANAQQSNSNLLAQIQSNIPSGNPSALTAQNLRNVLTNMVLSTNVAGIVCPSTPFITTYQPFANSFNGSTTVQLQIFDGTNCVTWGVLNTVNHTMALQTSTSIVANLPTCTATLQGARYFVTDQNTAIAYHGAVTGGGSNKQGVTCDGSAWYQD